MATAPNTYLTPEQYLEIERRAQEKSEYWNGEMFAMAGGSAAHSELTAAVISILRPQLLRRGCRVYDSNMRVRISATDLYTYPDVTAICGAPEFADGRKDTLVNPTLIVEVLSPSTEAYDRGKKFAQYRSIPSLREYLLIAQDQMQVELYIRTSSTTWELTVFTGTDAVVTLPSLSASIPLADLYQGVDLTAASE